MVVREYGTFKFSDCGKNIFYKHLTVKQIISAAKNDLLRFGFTMKTTPSGMYGLFEAENEKTCFKTTPHRIFSDAEHRFFDFTTNKFFLKEYPNGSKSFFEKRLAGFGYEVVGVTEFDRGAQLSVKNNKGKIEIIDLTKPIPKEEEESLYTPHKRGLYLYVLEFYSEYDSFIKVGVTKRDKIEERFKYNTFPYEYKVLMKEPTESAYHAETEIKRKYERYYPYVDALKNNGSTECFHIDNKIQIMRDIISYLKLKRDDYSDFLNSTVMEVNKLNK